MMSICPNILDSGTCSTPDCPHNHQVFPCDLCRIWCTTQHSLNQHIKGRQHQGNLSGTNNQGVVVRCNVCNIGVYGPVAQHERGRRHRALLKEMRDRGQAVTTITSAVQQGLTRCTVCARDVLSNEWTTHLRSPLHIRKERFTAYTTAIRESEKNKCGVHVEEEVLDYGVVEVDSLRDTPTVNAVFHVSLAYPAKVNFLEARMTSTQGRYAPNRPRYFFASFSGAKKMEFGKTYGLNVKFDPQGNRGRYEDRTELVFEDTTLRQRFVITRPVKAIVGVAADMAMLQPTAPYVRPTPVVVTRAPETNVIEGIRPPALAAIEWVGRLPEAHVPLYVRDALEDGSVGDKVGRVRRTLLPQNLNSDTYGRHWKMLLWIEEIRETIDLQQYDMSGKALGTPPRGISFYRYVLDVPGLAEKRPSVIIGDRIKVKHHNGRDQWWAGYVHRVEREQVFLKFHSTFVPIRGQLFDIRFELNRLCLRRMHMALETSFYPSRLLFPNATHLTGLRRPTRPQMDDINIVNRLIEDNDPQMMAVTAIVRQPAGSVPFVVFGPPGTGKTITIVEAIKQLVLRDRSARILACAPSNSAADVICERLIALGRSQIFRLNAPSRLKSTLPAILKDFCLENEETFTVPAPDVLKNYRVVVSTCMSAAVPSSIGLPRGHFTHIFVDEAGQALESEAMIPIKLIGGPNTNVILSGDPKQLGPIVRSPIAQRLGLGTSYLDRLTKLPVYDDRTHNGITVVKLTNNFRNHPAILKFPNEEFYRAELQPCADPVIIESLLHWSGLPRRGFPIIFHSIKGKDERQATSPSFFNADEASVVKKYVQDLRSDGRLRLTDNHIGIISPYNAQCLKIRSILRMQNPTIKVGSVEEFQGQERRVIIMSTVRSSTDLISYDLRHALGFLSQARRFNVAITRAQALLIIVGDPNVLGLDPLWRNFLNYIHQRGGWKGLPIPWDSNEETHGVGISASTNSDRYGASRRVEVETEMDELVQRTRLMVLGQLPADEGEAEDMAENMEGNADRPGREEA
ncbi:hypothetical protein FRC02_004060 [Tulasnella sp. 418]|nr:hypothetical protein FRC02_004060 [Tulasnella sp. 418]